MSTGPCIEQSGRRDPPHLRTFQLQPVPKTRRNQPKPNNETNVTRLSTSGWKEVNVRLSNTAGTVASVRRHHPCFRLPSPTSPRCYAKRWVGRKNGSLSDTKSMSCEFQLHLPPMTPLSPCTAASLHSPASFLDGKQRNQIESGPLSATLRNLGAKRQSVWFQKHQSTILNQNRTAPLENVKDLLPSNCLVVGTTPPSSSIKLPKIPNASHSKDRRDGWGGIFTRLSWFRNVEPGPLVSPLRSRRVRFQQDLKQEEQEEDHEQWEDIDDVDKKQQPSSSSSPSPSKHQLIHWHKISFRKVFLILLILVTLISISLNLFLFLHQTNHHPSSSSSMVPLSTTTSTSTLLPSITPSTSTMNESENQRIHSAVELSHRSVDSFFSSSLFHP